MKNNYFIKQLLPAIAFCLAFSVAFSEGIPRSYSINHNSLHQPADVIIRGTVSDDNGALRGATIRENGTNNTTTSKEDGTFSLRVSKPDAVLTISFVGYESMEIALEV